MPDELWEGDDQMPSCQTCLDGDHARCQDLLWDDRYGMHACGCRNEAHEEDG